MLEFAFVAPALIVLILSLMDAMWLMTIEFAVNDGLLEAARHGSLGVTPTSGTTREADIQSYMIIRAAGLLQAAQLTVTMTTYSSANAYATATAATTTSTGAGGTGQFVAYRAAYVQPLLSPLGLIYSSASYTHTVTYLVQNEPF